MAFLTITRSYALLTRMMIPLEVYSLGAGEQKGKFKPHCFGSGYDAAVDGMRTLARACCVVAGTNSANFESSTVGEAVSWTSSFHAIIWL